MNSKFKKQEKDKKKQEKAGIIEEKSKEYRTKHNQKKKKFQRGKSMAIDLFINDQRVKYPDNYGDPNYHAKSGYFSSKLRKWGPIDPIHGFEPDDNGCMECQFIHCRVCNDCHDDFNSKVVLNKSSQRSSFNIIKYDLWGHLQRVENDDEDHDEYEYVRDSSRFEKSVFHKKNDQKKKQTRRARRISRLLSGKHNKFDSMKLKNAKDGDDFALTVKRFDKNRIDPQDGEAEEEESDYRLSDDESDVSIETISTNSSDDESDVSIEIISTNSSDDEKLNPHPGPLLSLNEFIDIHFPNYNWQINSMEDFNIIKNDYQRYKRRHEDRMDWYNLGN